MAVRLSRGPLTPIEVRRIRDAVWAASRSDTPLNALLTIHPGRLVQPPADPGQFFRRRVMAWLGTWFQRNGCAWSALWVRENYEGPHREHLHMLLHLPRHLRRRLERALTRRWPEAEAVDLRTVNDPVGALAYILKQQTPQAHVSLGRRVRREHRCRYTDQPVADVLGRRVSMTLDLERNGRREETSPDCLRTSAPAGHTGYLIGRSGTRWLQRQ
jgi:hypothetical protein